MTDKQIIFKCDVDCIKKNTEECFELECIYGQESILRQLKSKEQECEKLKDIANRTLDKLNKYLDQQVQLDQLKAENDEWKKIFEDEDVQLALTEIRSGERHLWYNKADKLSKTLAEIKEITEDTIDMFYEGLETGSTYDRVETILQKISEVIPDEKS